MNIITQIKSYLQIILIVSLGFSLFRSCQKQKRTINDLIELNELSAEQKVVIIDATERIHSARVALVERGNKINQLLDTIKHLKDPIVITKVKIVTKIDTVFVPFETFTEKEIDGSIYIKTPQPFLKIDKWYTIKGTIKNNGVFFDSLQYVNDFYVATGTQDYGFIKNLFKRNDTIVTIKDNNPYSSTHELQQTVINAPKKRFHIGPQAGFILGEKRMVPSVGVGLTYSIISF